MSSRKGDRAERWLVNTVEDEFGGYAQRTGASGGATSRNRPDVIVMQDSEAWFVEVKSRTHPDTRFSKEEVHDLQEAAERAGATPLLLVRPSFNKYDQCHAFEPEELKENDKSYSIVNRMLPGRSVGEILTDD